MSSSHRTDLMSSSNGKDIPLQDVASFSSPQPRALPPQRKPVVITFLSDYGSSVANVVNALIQGTIRHHAEQPAYITEIVSKLIFETNYKNPLQKQQVHTVVKADEGFYKKIDMQKEETIYKSTRWYERELYDAHSFLLPQLQHVYTPTLRLLYGSISEVIVTYPSPTALRSSLFQLFQATSLSLERKRFLLAMYKQITGNTPTKRLQTPNQIIIHPSLVPKLGKTISYQSSDPFLQKARLFIRETLKHIYTTIGCLAVDIFVRLPCGLLQSNCELCLLTAQLIQHPETNSRLVQIINLTEVLIIGLQKQSLSMSVGAVLKHSNFLSNFFTSPNASSNLICIDIKSYENVPDRNEGGRDEFEKMNIATLLRACITSPTLSLHSDTIIDMVRWSSIYPEYFVRNRLPLPGEPLPDEQGTQLPGEKQQESQLPLLAAWILSWPLSKTGIQLDLGIEWKELKGAIWAGMGGTAQHLTETFLAFEKLLEAANYFDQRLSHSTGNYYHMHNTRKGQHSSHTPKYRPTNTLYRKHRQIPRLTDLSVQCIIDNISFLPVLDGALPEVLVASILKSLIEAGKLDDPSLCKLLDPSIEHLDVSTSAMVRNLSCDIIADRCPHLLSLSLASCLNVGNEGIRAIVKSTGKTLHTINLSGCSSVTDDSINEIASHCKQLVHLNLTGCVRITPTATAKLSQCPLLESLILKRCQQITDPVVEALGSQLQSLDLTECDQITDNGVSTIAMKSENLKSLKLSGQKITDRCLQEVAGHCLNLEHLELMNCTHISNSSIQIITQSCSQLESLALSNCGNITPAEFFSQMAASLSNLHTLDLSDCTHVTDVAIDRIVSACPNLRALNLTSCENITDHGLIRLAQGRPDLTSLNLSRCFIITDNSITIVAQHCTKLEKLWLRNCTKLTDMSVIHLTKYCRNIKLFDISFCDVTTNSIKQIPAGFPNLETLLMEELPNLISTALSSLSGCSMLMRLNMAYCPYVTDEVITTLARGCPAIESLDISNCNKITLPALQNVLSQWPRLEILKLSRYSRISCNGIAHSHLLQLDLSWCFSLEDQAVKEIVNGCPRLQTLELAYCTKITDQALTFISQSAPQLSSLNIRGCKLSHGAVGLVSSGRVIYR